MARPKPLILSTSNYRIKGFLTVDDANFQNLKLERKINSWKTRLFGNGKVKMRSIPTVKLFLSLNLGWKFFLIRDCFKLWNFYFKGCNCWHHWKFFLHSKIRGKLYHDKVSFLKRKTVNLGRKQRFGWCLKKWQSKNCLKLWQNNISYMMRSLNFK